jgi:hypothetical protein
MKNLPEARVARLAECHKKQKAGYDQHASPFNQHTSLQNGKLIEFMLHCQKSGFSNATTRTKFKVLKTMRNNNVNLQDPEAVKLFIAQRKSWSNGHKQIAVYAYNEYTKMEKIQWQARPALNKKTKKQK